MLKDLESVKREDIYPEFIVLFNEFAEHVYNATKAKTIEGQPIAGRSKQYLFRFCPGTGKGGYIHTKIMQKYNG